MMQNSESGSKLDNSHSSLPEEIILLTKKYFPQGIIQNSLKFVRQSKVSISYKKGQVDQYYICSGIVKDDRSHECKINYKSRLEGTSEQALSSNCDCVLWKRESHCQHTLALFITFHLHEFLDRHAHNAEHLDLQGIQSEAPPLSFMSSLGVSPEEYGTLILSPNQLVQAPYGATYSQLQYILHSKKIIPFPLPSNFVGQLVIYFNDNQQMRFAYLEPEHNNLSEQDAAPKKLSKEVSLFENLYLFHWKTGQAFHLTQDIKQLIARLRSFQFHLSYNELLYSIFELNLTQHVQIFYENQNILSLPKVSPSTRVVINPGDKKTLLEFKLEFFDHAEKLLMPPLMLSQLTFGTGILTSFRKKNEAYDFLETIVRSIEDRSQNYKKHLHSTSKKNRIISLVEQVFKEEQSIVFDDINLCLIVYDNSFVLALLKNIYEKFSEQFFRFAYFQDVSKSLTYKIAPQQLFEGLQPFSKFAKNYAIQIFYDRQEISKWNSRIKFERRSSSTKWFDLELSMTNDDWKIIQEANIDNGIVITNSGLILLSDEEKDLIRMMQKYSKYEGKTVPLSELTEDELNKNVKKFILPFNKSRIFELFELKKLGIDGALDEAELALCRRLETLQEMPHYPLPENLEGVLRPYQVTGFNWLRFLHEANLGACLADDMGLGKTLQTIAFLQSIYHQIERVLIVCPVTILLNWEKEIQKFSNMEHHIYHGGSRHFPKDKKIILTSYGVMKKETDDLFLHEEFDILILDEVQHLKNVRSLGAFSARKIQAKFRVCLTGTPVENDLSEFYNILDLSIPGIWGDLQFVRTTSNTKSRLLAKKTASPFILRRTKGQVLHDLPPKIENNQFIEFTEDEKKFYQKNMSLIKNKISLAHSTNKYGEILKGLLQLRQNCLWQTETGNLDFKNIQSSKIEFLLETLESILEEGHQAIIFSQFTTYLDIIQHHIHEKHWKFSRIDGTQSINKRQEQVELFQSGKNPVFLISLKAGGVGLNLTAASFVFVMDPWWNPAVEQQAIDRAHRIGQKNTLTVYRPIIKGSVEEKVLLLQEQKKQLFHDLLSTDGDQDQTFSGKLTMKDFEMLFN